MIRLKDIALRAGVSVMTVSKVMRDAPDISATTKLRIREMAKQMGYVPDTTAQGLRNRTTKLLGVIIPSMINPMFARIVVALEEQTRSLGYELILSHSQNSLEREEDSIVRLLSRRVDGLFIAPVYRLDQESPVYAKLHARGTPTVLLGHKSAFCQAFANVETDDFRGSHAATTHLLQLGHQKIAFLAGPSAAPWALERFEGYRRALRDASIEFDERLIFQAGTTIEEGAKAAVQLLSESVKPTAIQAVNDMVAIGASNTLLQQNLKIPSDLSVVGFGNILLSEHYRVPLTTVHQPKYRLGAAAVELMMKLLKQLPPLSRRLPVELMIRQSTAAPSHQL